MAVRINIESSLANINHESFQFTGNQTYFFIGHYFMYAFLFHQFLYWLSLKQYLLTDNFLQSSISTYTLTRLYGLVFAPNEFIECSNLFIRLYVIEVYSLTKRSTFHQMIRLRTHKAIAIARIISRFTFHQMIRLKTIILHRVYLLLRNLHFIK